jgi:hypothetical protein
VKASVLALLLGTAFAQLPNHSITPGAVRTSDAKEICATTFRTAKYRKTTHAMKIEVCHNYGLSDCPHAGRIEIDHLVPLELGGLDDESNLWPQLAKYPDHSPGFHVKDKLENELHRRVCKKQMSLQAAQTCLVDNWMTCYSRVFGKDPK